MILKQISTSNKCLCQTLPVGIRVQQQLTLIRGLNRFRIRYHSQYSLEPEQEKAIKSSRFSLIKIA